MVIFKNKLCDEIEREIWTYLIVKFSHIYTNYYLIIVNIRQDASVKGMRYYLYSILERDSTGTTFLRAQIVSSVICSESNG